jgi:hypothetical protein
VKEHVKGLGQRKRAVYWRAGEVGICPQTMLTATPVKNPVITD